MESHRWGTDFDHDVFYSDEADATLLQDIGVFFIQGSEAGSKEGVSWDDLTEEEQQTFSKAIAKEMHSMVDKLGRCR